MTKVALAVVSILSATPQDATDPLERMLDAYPVRSIRGFRAFSARKQLPLEDYRWFFEASMAFGRRWPSLTQEVNVEIEKPAA